MGKKNSQSQKQNMQSSNQKQNYLLQIFIGILIAGIVLFVFNNNVSSEEKQTIQADTNYQNKNLEKKTILINTDRKVESKIIKDYFLDKKDKYKVIHKYTQKNHSTNFYLQWAHFHWDINFQSQKQGQILSHLPDAEAIYDDKNKMLDILGKFDAQTNYNIKSEHFLPKTYTWDIKQKRISKSEKELFALRGDTDKWIVKNPKGMGGKGIKLIEDIQEYAKQIKAAKQTSNNDPEFLRFKQAQKYIKNPLLYQGRKAEYRAYALIASTDPFLIIFNKGFIKSALRKYDYKSNDMKAHLTNLAEARKNEDEYNQMKDSAYLNIEKFEEYLNSLGKSQQDINKLYEQMTSLVAYTMMAGKQYMTRKKGLFETFAIDILFDEDLNPYLLEINQPYAVEGALENGYKDILPDFYNGTLDLVLQLNENQDNINQLLKNPESLKLGKNMEIVYNEVTGYDYLQNIKHFN